jgi:hypothetical protein
MRTADGTYARLTSVRGGKKIARFTELDDENFVRNWHFENVNLGIVNPKSKCLRLSKIEVSELREVNRYLNHATGTNLMKEIHNLCENGELTERSLGIFLKSEYPGADEPKNLTPKDLSHLQLFYKFGLQKIDEFAGQNFGENSVIIACCRPLPNLDYYDHFLDDSYWEN